MCLVLLNFLTACVFCPVRLYYSMYLYHTLRSLSPKIYLPPLPPRITILECFEDKKLYIAFGLYTNFDAIRSFRYYSQLLSAELYVMLCDLLLLFWNYCYVWLIIWIRIIAICRLYMLWLRYLCPLFHKLLHRLFIEKDITQ